MGGWCSDGPLVCDKKKGQAEHDMNKKLFGCIPFRRLYATRAFNRRGYLVSTFMWRNDNSDRVNGSDVSVVLLI